MYIRFLCIAEYIAMTHFHQINYRTDIQIENMTIKEAQQAVDQWIKEYGVRYFSELTNMACLTEEVGELGRVIAR